MDTQILVNWKSSIELKGKYILPLVMAAIQESRAYDTKLLPASCDECLCRGVQLKSEDIPFTDDEVFATVAFHLSIGQTIRLNF